MSTGPCPAAHGRTRSNALDVKMEVMHIHPAYRQTADHPLALKVIDALQLAHGYRPDEFVATSMGVYLLATPA